jgi:shikimate kinase
MGSGKSTVGRRIARSLGIPFIDLDAEIVKRAGRPITEIFAQEGEAGFRDLEHAVLSEVCRRGECAVVATGGGIVVNAENRRLMREAGLVVNLTVDLATVAERLAGDASRPLLKDGMSAAAALLASRAAAYAEADLQVATAHQTPHEVAKEIIDWLQHDTP